MVDEAFMGAELSSRDRLDRVLGVKPGQPSRTLSSGSAFDRFAKGFGLPFRGLKLVLTHGRLFGWSAIVAGVCLFLLAGLFALVWLYVPTVFALLWEKPEGWLRFVWYTLVFLVGSGLFVMGASSIPPVATAPFQDPLTTNVERVLGAIPDGGGGVKKLVFETTNSVLKAVMRLVLLWSGHAVLFVIWLIPGLGQLIWTPLSILWTTFWLAYEYLDLPANRYDYAFREVLQTVRDNLALCMGFGTATYLMLWIPLLNVLFIPVAAVGATILFVDLRATGRMAPSAAERRIARL